MRWADAAKSALLGARDGDQTAEEVAATLAAAAVARKAAGRHASAGEPLTLAADAGRGEGKVSGLAPTLVAVMASRPQLLDYMLRQIEHRGLLCPRALLPALLRSSNARAETLGDRGDWLAEAMALGSPGSAGKARFEALLSQPLMRVQLEAFHAHAEEHLEIAAGWIKESWAFLSPVQRFETTRRLWMAFDAVDADLVELAKAERSRDMRVLVVMKLVRLGDPEAISFAQEALSSAVELSENRLVMRAPSGQVEAFALHNMKPPRPKKVSQPAELAADYLRLLPPSETERLSGPIETWLSGTMDSQAGQFVAEALLDASRFFKEPRIARVILEYWVQNGRPATLSAPDWSVFSQNELDGLLRSSLEIADLANRDEKIMALGNEVDEWSEATSQLFVSRLRQPAHFAAAPPNISSMLSFVARLHPSAIKELCQVADDWAQRHYRSAFETFRELVHLRMEFDAKLKELL